MKVPLSLGYEAMIDDEDWASLVGIYLYAFQTSSGVYAVHRWASGDVLPLTHFLLEVPEGSVVKHLNGDTLDCRRSNLLVMGRDVVGLMRQKQTRAATSIYKGVYWDRQTGRWRARLQRRGTSQSLGYYQTPELAKAAYDAAAAVLLPCAKGCPAQVVFESSR